MKYPFPNVGMRCLLCGASSCSRWKGYYVREVVCVRMRYAGPIAIHLAQCQRRGVDYTYWPDILIPYLRPTIPTLKIFYSTWIQKNSIRAAIDEVVGSIKQDFALGFSMAYLWLNYVVRALILNHTSLKIRVPESVTSTELRIYHTSQVLPVFEGVRPWSPAQRITVAPP